MSGREFGLSFTLWLEGWIEALVIVDSRVLEFLWEDYGGIFLCFVFICYFMSFLPSSVQTFEELGDFKALGSG